MRIKNLFDVEKLKTRCQQSISSLLGTKEPNEPPHMLSVFQYRFINNGGSVLAVAHTDTAFNTIQQEFRVFGYGKDTVVMSPSLDDRLGVYVVLDLLPLMGVKVDVLLTDGEEFGASSAENFVTTKQYNWIVEFDRCGSDVVTYDYDWEDVLRPFFKVEVGSFSDIVDLKQLNCMGFNVGIGYHNEHTMYCCANMTELEKQLLLFKRFWDVNKDVYFEQKLKVIKKFTYSSNWNSYNRNTQLLHEEEVYGLSEKELEEEFGYYEDTVLCRRCSMVWGDEMLLYERDGYACPTCGNLLMDEFCRVLVEPV